MKEQKNILYMADFCAGEEIHGRIERKASLLLKAFM